MSFGSDIPVHEPHVCDVMDSESIDPHFLRVHVNSTAQAQNRTAHGVMGGPRRFH